MDLYTSLTRLKMAMNGGVMPPMTPVPLEVQNVIDPAFTPGLGALEEDAERGLRCPIRDCGQYFHSLTLHLNRGHRRFGGAKKIKELLDIPETARLVSIVLSDKKAALIAARPAGWRSYEKDPSYTVKPGSIAGHKSRMRSTMGARNLKNECERQLQHALLDLKSRLGRAPDQREVIELLPNGAQVIVAIRRSYGTFNNFKAQIGLETFGPNGTAARKFKHSLTKEMVLDAYREWYRVHGSLPGSWTVNYGNRTPVLPRCEAVKRVMETDSWPEAMRRVASRLLIYGGRYGIPMEHKPAEAA